MDELSEHFEFIKTYLPKYLTPKLQEKLFKDLREDFPNSTNPNKIYVKLNNTSVFYQGDVIIDVPFPLWNLEALSFDTKYYTAAILSNTCDINPEKPKIQDIRVALAAVFSLAQYVKLLKKREIKKRRISSFLDRLKKNEISNLFYLPELKRSSEVSGTE